MSNISVIITAYRTSEYIEECLDSIYVQKPNEIIIGVDGCVTTLNKLLEIKYKYENLKIFFTPHNVGTYILRNSLLKKCQCDKILFFDSDDILLPDSIRIISENLEKYDVIRYNFINLSEEKIIYQNKCKNLYANGTFGIKKDVFKLTGGFHSWKCAADYEYQKRIDGFFNILHIKEPVFIYRRHDKSLTSCENTKIKSSIREGYHKMIPEKYDNYYIPTQYIEINEMFSNIKTNWLKHADEQYHIKNKIKKPHILFTVWVGTDELPILQQMCLKSMVLSGNIIKLYSYIKYKDIPDGVIWIDLNDIFPKEKCLSNYELTGKTNVGTSYSSTGDLIRLTILKNSNDTWVDSDVFVIENINKFNKKNIISGIISGWYKKQTTCFGVMNVSKLKGIKKELDSLIDDYILNDNKPTDYSKYIKYIQNELINNNFNDVRDNFLSHLFCCPISVKHKDDLKTNFKIPVILRKYIFGIHLWNTGFAEKEFNHIYKNKNTLFGQLYYSILTEEREEFIKRISEIFTENYDNTNIDKFYLNNIKFYEDVDKWSENNNIKYNDINIIRDCDYLLLKGSPPKKYVINCNKSSIQQKQPTTKKPHQKIITTQPENGNIYAISSQETSRQLKTIQDTIKEFSVIEPTPLDFPEVLNLSYLFEQKLKHDKREIAKKKKEISYSITVRNIIKKAKENKFRKVIIFQDGISFDKDPNTIIPQLEELPENFGICFLGGYFRKPFLGSFYDYNEHFLELKGSFKIWGTHAIVIGQEIYDVLIKALTINFDKSFQELLCSIIVGKYPSYTYNLPFVFYDEHFLNRYSINNVPVKTLKQDNSNIIKKSKNKKSKNNK